MNTLNNSYDRDLSEMELDSQTTQNNQTRQNILSILQLQEHRRKARLQAIRASYISPKDQF